MVDSPQFTGSVPEAYDAFMVPLLFQPYADRLAALAAGRPAARLPSHDVLEVAAGTGVLSRALGAALPDAEITATDVSPDMLEVAARHPTPGRLTYRRADAGALPFADASFDLVVSQFGIMFFPDRVGALAQFRRVLRPGGEVLVLTWDSLAANPLVDAAFTAIGELVPGQREFVGTGPHGYHDPARLRADAEAAGLRVDSCAPMRLTVTAPSARDVAVAFTLGSPVRAALQQHGMDPGPVVDAAEAAVRVRFGDGPVSAELSALLLSGTRTDS